MNSIPFAEKERYHILAMDAFYEANRGHFVAVLGNSLDDKIEWVKQEWIDGIEAYVPGEFYKRELPGLMHLLQDLDWSKIDCLLVDGYVKVGEKPGLGAHLYVALNNQLPVIGVAKTQFHGNAANVMEVLRGESKNALFVSAIGMDIHAAANLVQNMHGAHRIPTLLKELDRLTRENMGAK